MGRDGQRGVLGAGICSSAAAPPWPDSEGELPTCTGADLAWAQPSALGGGVRRAPGRETSLLPSAALLAVRLSLLGVK